MTTTALKIAGLGTALAASGYVMTRAIGKDVSEENAKLTMGTGLRSVLGGAAIGVSVSQFVNMGLGKSVPGKAVGVAMAAAGASLLLDLAMPNQPAVLFTNKFFSN